MGFTPTTTDHKQSVRAASTANLTLSAPGASIDGVSLTNGDRVLVKDQSTGADNGIYEWTGAATAMVRAGDFRRDRDVTAGARVSVTEGTANADTTWVLTTNDPITVGSTSLTFTASGGSVASLDDIGNVNTTGVVDGSLLRYEATGAEWQDTTSSNLLLSDAGQLQVPTVGSAGGLLLGGDTNLYRSAANVLSTDDALTVGGDITLSGGDLISTSSALIFSTSSTAQTLRIVQAASFSDTVTASFMQIGDATNQYGVITGASGAVLDRLSVSADAVIFSDDSHASIQPPVSLVNLEGTGLAEGLTFGSDQASPVTLYHSAANTIALDTNDKIQQATLPTVANDLVNQVWAERMDFFYM